MKTNPFRVLRMLPALAISCLVLPHETLAGSPIDWLQATVVEVKSTPSREASEGQPVREPSRELARVLGERFAFPEMARLALGRHWEQRLPEEREEFVSLFRRLFERSHLFRQLTSMGHAGTAHRYVGEQIDGDRATVQAVVKTGQEELPVQYVLIRQDGTWRICDLGIDGVPLSRTYQAQFHKIISQSSYEELIRQMHRKLEEASFDAEVPR